MRVIILFILSTGSRQQLAFMYMTISCRRPALLRTTSRSLWCHGGATLSPSPQTAGQNKTAQNTAELEHHYARTHSAAAANRSPAPLLRHPPRLFTRVPASAGQSHSKSAHPAQEPTNEMISFYLSAHTPVWPHFPASKPGNSFWDSRDPPLRSDSKPGLATLSYHTVRAVSWLSIRPPMDLVTVFRICQRGPSL